MDRGNQTPSVPQDSEMHRGDQTPSVPQSSGKILQMASFSATSTFMIGSPPLLNSTSCSGGEMAPSIWNGLHTYTLIVSPGEHIEQKIRAFVKRAQTDLFVVTATGVASVVTLVGIRGENEMHTYMRNLEIMTLSGTFTIDDYEEVRGYLASLSLIFFTVYMVVEFMDLSKLVAL